MKRHVIVIHGGDVFETYRQYLSGLKKMPVDMSDFVRSKERKWKDTLGDKLGPKFEVLYPHMPNGTWNDRYIEWKIWFEKMIPFIQAGAIFVGHSLGGIFLARYFSENVFPKKVRAVFLVAAPYKRKKKGRPNYFAGFALNGDISLMTEQAEDVYLYHSKDDPIATFSYLKRYEKELPDAHGVALNGRGHFLGAEFPEIVKAIKSLS